MTQNEHPNILWYCTDAQRYDTIGALGNSHIRTPNVDRLAARGVAFKRAYSQSTLCHAKPSEFSHRTLLRLSPRLPQWRGTVSAG